MKKQLRIRMHNSRQASRLLAMCRMGSNRSSIYQALILKETIKPMKLSSLFRILTQMQLLSNPGREVSREVKAEAIYIIFIVHRKALMETTKIAIHPIKRAKSKKSRHLEVGSQGKLKLKLILCSKRFSNASSSRTSKTSNSKMI